MSGIAIYTRDESGLITYRGKRDWDSRAQVIDYYSLPETGKSERLLGWPHASVTWHGDLGFGEDAHGLIGEAQA